MIVSVSKFDLGKIFMTAGVSDKIPMDDVLHCLAKHAVCDYGDLCDEDKQNNNYSVANNCGMVMSVWYSTDKNEKFWIISYPSDYTTVLLPDEY